MEKQSNNQDIDKDLEYAKYFGQEMFIEDISLEELENFSADPVSAGSSASFEHENYTFAPPELVTPNVDVFWESAEFDGPELPSDVDATPDQSVIDDLARPWGLEYAYDEELNIERKLEQIERQRHENEGRQQ